MNDVTREIIDYSNRVDLNFNQELFQQLLLYIIKENTRERVTEIEQSLGIIFLMCLVLIN